MLKTDEQVKKECIKELEKLIQTIKQDTTSTDYSFNYDVIRLIREPYGSIADVRYSLEFTKYTPK